MKEIEFKSVAPTGHALPSPYRIVAEEGSDMLMFERLESRTLFSAQPLDSSPPGGFDGGGGLPPLPPVGTSPSPTPPALPPVGTGNPTMSPAVRRELRKLDRSVAGFNAQDASLTKAENGLIIQYTARDNTITSLNARLTADEQVIPQTTKLLRAEKQLEHQIAADQTAADRIYSHYTADEAKVTANSTLATSLVAQFNALEASST